MPRAVEVKAQPRRASLAPTNRTHALRSLASPLRAQVDLLPPSVRERILRCKHREMRRFTMVAVGVVALLFVEAIVAYVFAVPPKSLATIIGTTLLGSALFKFIIWLVTDAMARDKRRRTRDDLIAELHQIKSLFPETTERLRGCETWYAEKPHSAQAMAWYSRQGIYLQHQMEIRGGLKQLLERGVWTRFEIDCTRKIIDDCLVFCMTESTYTQCVVDDLPAPYEEFLRLLAKAIAVDLR